jgi:2-amino-4-hydroxy-6-hydroxymethyldihydropteridine diphosphokinase
MVYLGLGSNLNDPLSQLRSGLKSIASIIFSGQAQSSCFVTTPPLGGMDQPLYYNCVCAGETNLNPFECLAKCRQIEDDHGRVRGEHWGPRTLDIDILLFGHEKINGDDLSIPHPGIEKRDFVLVPLLDIKNELCNLDGTPYRKILDQLQQDQKSQLRVLA